VDVRNYRVRSLREKIAIVLRIRCCSAGASRHLRYGRLDASPQEIEDAARAAHAHEFISHLAKATTRDRRAGGDSPRRAPRLSVARAF